MFIRLVQKELLHHLLDFRFIAVFALCALLSWLSISVGIQNYRLQLREHNAISENNRTALQFRLERNDLDILRYNSHRWNRRPEVLSPVVYGLSGTLGQEAEIKYQWPTHFEGSLFATDPVHALFGVLDLSFIVKVVLSLCALILTYDAVCGEKEAGTLRLYASFPVTRSALALAKLAGSTIAVLVPFIFAYVLASTFMALAPGLGLRGDDWTRLLSLMGVFGLYLVVFTAFGLWISAATHRRMVAFLWLLGLWTLWLFVVPELVIRISRTLIPVESVYDLERRCSALRWEIREQREAEFSEWREQSKGQRRPDGLEKIRAKWDAELYAQIGQMQQTRRNQMQNQQRLTAILSSVSPLGALSFASMDLARTGFYHQEQVEIALNAYQTYMAGVIQKQWHKWPDWDLSDYSTFTYRNTDPFEASLSRNAFYILNLALLAILGFAGGYVAILRYDVR